VWNSLNETADEDLPPERTTAEILDDMDASPELRKAAEEGTLFSEDYEGSEIERANYVFEVGKEKGARVAYAAAKNYDDIEPIVDPGSAAEKGLVEALTGKETGASMVETAALLYKINKNSEANTGRKMFGNPFALAFHKITDFEYVETDFRGVPVDYDTWDWTTRKIYDDWLEEQGQKSVKERKEEHQKSVDSHEMESTGMYYDWETGEFVDTPPASVDTAPSGGSENILQYTEDPFAMPTSIVDGVFNGAVAGMQILTAPYFYRGGGGGNPYDFPAPTSSTDIATLVAAIQGIQQAYNPDAIAAAVESAIIRGMSGVTIEQGNVVLNTGSLVGTLTPILNQKFGALLGRASRG
jgi:hypothetical protein